MFEIKEYVRNKQGQKVGILYARNCNGGFELFTGFCNTKHDKFVDDLETTTFFNGDRSRIPYDHKEQFGRFLNRCLNYFRGHVAYPKWMNRVEVKEEKVRQNKCRANVTFVHGSNVLHECDGLPAGNTYIFNKQLYVPTNIFHISDYDIDQSYYEIHVKRA